MLNDDQKKPINNSLPPVMDDPLPPIQSTPTEPKIDISTGSAAPSDDIIVDTVMPEVIISSSPKKKFAGGKVIATILGLFLLVGGVGAGVFLTGQNQNIEEQAGDCAGGNCGWELRDRCEKLEWCKNSGCSQEWQSDCAPDRPQITASCQNIKAYSDTWAVLSNTDLSRKTAGSVVNFCVAGATDGSSFDKAKFSINGVQKAETTATRANRAPTDTNEFCDSYTIPTGVTTFNVSAEIHHITLGWK